ncbi:unnamed protein product [Symbiodinium necroappetens]|uniref:Uncharacterized protein n=1 Tax=Symbiodinium necroappetens TaxID=1628268 RepID=A0A813A689_9DINO|nr:unnamed protein product [Symbiodinium necroappetens]
MPDLLATATNITGSNFGSSVKCVVHRINTFRCISLTVPHCFVTFRKRLEFEDFNRSALLARFLLVECAGPVQAPIKAVLPSVERAVAEPPLQPAGIAGSTPIAFGGGAVMSERHFRDLRRQDPAAFV